MTLETLLILALASWRVAHLLVDERGILGIGDRVRALAGVKTGTDTHMIGTQPYTTTECAGSNEIALMLCCIYCTSFWLSGAMLALWVVGTGLSLSWIQAIVDWLAIAALCIVCEKINQYV